MFLRRQKYRYWLSATGTALIVMLLVALLAACGSSGPTSGGQGGQTSGQVQNCGKLDTAPNGLLGSDAKAQAQQVENCFWQAFQKCQAATLTFTKRGIDSGVIHTFTLQKQNDKCSISDATQAYIAPNPPKAGQTYTCTGLTQQADGLHFATCGSEGDITVPAM